MIAFRSILFLLLALCTATGQQQVEPANDTSVLNLPDGSKFKTPIYGMKIIGQLRTSNKLPYFILSGTTCTGCDENTSIYIHSPSDGPMKNEGEQPRFSYPGVETDYQSGKIDYKGRMFFGDCLRNHPNAVVWFEKALGADKRWHESVLVAEVKDDRLTTTKLRVDLAQASEAQAAVGGGQCHELPGRKSYSEP